MSRPIYALFGGSFDPPHLGHKEIIKKALELKEVDGIIVVPTFINPFKSSFNLDPKQRFELVKNSFSDIGLVEFSPYEIEQQRAVYTIETFKELSNKYSIKYIIIGEDNLNTITKWKEFNKLNNNISWIVATRGNNISQNLPLYRYTIINLEINVSSSEIRANKKLDFIDKKIKSQVINLYKLKDTNLQDTLTKIVHFLDEKKATDIETFDLSDKDYIAKSVILANSIGGKHTSALYDYIKEEVKNYDLKVLASDISDDWIVIDLGEILIHIMTPQYRMRYSLEEFLSEIKAGKFSEEE